MKANEFIKKQGLAEAKRVLHDARGCVGVKLWGRYEFSAEDLKRLVESHELVKVWQLPEEDNDETGVDGARMYLECYAFYSTDEEKAKLDRLEQAILDVESCQ